MIWVFEHMNGRSRAFVLVLLVGCGPEGEPSQSESALRYSATLCASNESCGCADHFENRDQCERVLAERFDATATGRDVSIECVDRFVSNAGSLCESLNTWDSEDRCSMLSRPGKEGDSCSAHYEVPFAFVNDCGSGLLCSQGVCRSKPQPIDVKGEGSTCNARVPGTCGAADLYCGDDGQCHVTGVEGEECTSAYDCYEAEKILYCAGVSSGIGVCSIKPSLGEACDPLDYYPCVPGTTEETRMTWCDPASRTCKVGSGPAACEGLGVPFAWP